MHAVSEASSIFIFILQYTVYVNAFVSGYVRAMTGRSVEGLSGDAFEEFIGEAIAAFKSKLPAQIAGQYWEHTGRRIYVVARK